MSLFEQVLELTLSFEGGYSDHPTDPGGATMRGVTQRTFDAYLRGKGEPTRDVREIADAELRDIYRTGYWDAIRADELPAALAVVAFDVAVNHGPARALQWLAEGAADPVSLSARRMEHYTALTTLWPTFGRGWARRTTRVLKAANEIGQLG